MTELTGMTPQELSDWCKAQGMPAFRGKQIFRWIHQGADFDAMTNLPAAMRAQLKEIAVAQPVSIIDERKSQIDDTVKFLFGLKDGNCVEGVLMHYHHGYTLCISTQVGCRMGCKFCASTLEGCVRSLTAGEMLGEVLAANRYLDGKDRVHNIVLMGSGEPLDNYDSVCRFLRLLREEDGVNIGLRNVSLSTCGLVPKMYQFAEENLPVTLSVSLHAPNDEIRRQTMPVANAYPMDELLAACRNYIDKTGRRVIFEYALVGGVNCEEKHAIELASRLRGMQCHVNLIPLNAVEERHLKGVNEQTVQRFLHKLEELHISATRRREMGDDIEGACGQLRRKTLTTLHGPAGRRSMSRKIRFSKESQSSLNDFFVHRSPEQPKSKAEENLPAGILSAFRTDVGKVRANNQDAPIVSEKLRLYGVADGMGGHKGGEVASTSARDDLLRELEGKTPSVAALSGAIEEVNRQIYHQQEHDDALTGMGTTLSVLWMSDNFVYIGHVGDSRVYLLRDGEFKQMTLDHSLVEQLVREGVLTEEEAQNHPMRNIITRAIGTDESVEVDVVVEERRKGDLWLACSDGLHGLVDDRQMRDALRQYAPEKAADVLLKAALDAGGRDNVTLVIVHDGEETA